MNPLDLAVIAILVLSAVWALFRGFVREVLAIAGWVGAAWLTFRLFPTVQPYARQYIDSDIGADVAAGAATFIVLLILFALLGSLIANMVRGSAISPVDRSLGFVFGLLRGAIVVSLAYLALVWIFPAEQEPDWMAEALSRPWLERGALLIYSAIPEETLAEVTQPVRQGIRDRLGEGGLPTLEELSRPQPGSDTSPPQGYGSEREDLQRLLEAETGRDR